MTFNINCGMVYTASDTDLHKQAVQSDSKRKRVLGVCYLQTESNTRIRLLVGCEMSHSVLVADVNVFDGDLNVLDHAGDQLLNKPRILAGLVI